MSSLICRCGHILFRHIRWLSNCNYNKNCNHVVLSFPEYSCTCDKFVSSDPIPTLEKCSVCGHSKNDHEVVHDTEGGTCSVYSSSYCNCNYYKPDNLSLIEAIAKQKRLV